MIRTLFTLLSVFLLCTCGRAQKMNTADSLRSRLSASLRDSAKVEIYTEIIGEELKKRDTLTAKLYLDTLLQFATAMGKARPWGRYHYMKGQLFLKQQRWEDALTEASKSLSFYQETGNDLLLFDAYWLAGLVNIRMGENEQAFGHYLTALEYARSSGSNRAVFQALNELGNAHRRSGNFEQAGPYYEEAITVARKKEWIREQVAAVNNLAIVRKNQQQFDEARELYHDGLALTEQMEEPTRSIQQGYFYVNLASMENSLKQAGEALAYAGLARDRFAENGSPREQAAALLQMGTASGRLGYYTASEQYYRDARRVGADYVGIVRASTQGLISVFKNAGPLDSAVFYLEQAAAQTKEDAEKNRVEAIAEMEARYQNEQKQAEINRLALEDQLSQAQISQQRWLIYGGLLLLGLLVSFLYFLVQQRKRIRGQNETIRKSLGEKETLLKEIHHRVKNNLQMVSSLLSLQGDYIKDKAALDAIEMGQQRVRSMAIIHQRLYLRDEITTGISTRDYLGQLTGELISALNVNGLALTLKKELEDIDIDIDRMIPLGLVANELITNSLKHAFGGRESGCLRIKFRRVEEDVELMVADDGWGTDAGTVGEEDSFGNLLIRTFTEQLEGELRIDSTNGTTVWLRFPL